MNESPRYQGTQITARPDFTGRGGKAWHIELPDPAVRKGLTTGTVAAYIVQAPGAHPAWDHYVIAVVHLRPIAGAPPPFLQQPGMTHEFQIIALDPGEPLPALETDPEGFKLRYLTPIDLTHQVELPDIGPHISGDATAAEMLDLMIRLIVDGQISPDQDYRSVWRDLLTECAARPPHQGPVA